MSCARRSSVAGDGGPRRVMNDVDDDVSSTASGYSTTRSRRAGSLVRDRTSSSYLNDDIPLRTTMMDMSSTTSRGGAYLPLGGGYDVTSSYEQRSTISYPSAPQSSSFQTRGARLFTDNVMRFILRYSVSLGALL